jgi:hypothetical protein
MVVADAGRRSASLATPCDVGYSDVRNELDDTFVHPACEYARWKATPSLASRLKNGAVFRECPYRSR